MADTNGGIKLVKEFFGMNMQELKAEWSPMPDADKAQIVQGLKDGTLTY